MEKKWAAYTQLSIWQLGTIQKMVENKPKKKKKTQQIGPFK